MISTKFKKSSSILISTAVSLFCIGCSQSNLTGVTETGALKIQEATTNLNTKAIEGQVAATELNPITSDNTTTSAPAENTELKEKRPCPPPPPPCGEKKAKIEGETQTADVTLETAVFTTAAETTEGTEQAELKEKRPCPPPPPPCDEMKAKEKAQEGGEATVEGAQANLEEKTKEECKKDEKKGPPPPRAEKSEAGEEGESSVKRQAPPPPKMKSESGQSATTEMTSGTTTGQMQGGQRPPQGQGRPQGGSAKGAK